MFFPLQYSDMNDLLNFVVKLLITEHRSEDKVDWEPNSVELVG